MVDEATDNRIWALATLRSLETVLQSLGSPTHADIDHVNLFHQALDRLGEIGERVGHLRVPREQIEDRRARGGTVHVDRDVLYARVLTVIDYFAIRQAVLETARQMHEEPHRMIGFETR